MENMDQKISTLFNVVQLKREAVAKAEQDCKQLWKTTCSITIGNDNQPKNIQSLKNESAVQNVVTQLLMHRHFAKESADLLGLKFDNLYQNFSYEDWIDDCRKRLSILQITAEKKKLNELEERLNLVVSPEQRRAMEIEAITKSLEA